MKQIGPVSLWLLLNSVCLAADDNAAIAILQQKCTACHGDASGMSGLKVTTRENLL